MIEIKEADIHLRGDYIEYIGDFVRLLIALDNIPKAKLAFEKAKEIYETGSYEIVEDIDKNDPTTFIVKPSEKENMA